MLAPVLVVFANLLLCFQIQMYTTDVGRQNRAKMTGGAGTGNAHTRKRDYTNDRLRPMSGRTVADYYYPLCMKSFKIHTRLPTRPYVCRSMYVPSLFVCRFRMAVVLHNCSCTWYVLAECATFSRYWDCSADGRLLGTTRRRDLSFIFCLVPPPSGVSFDAIKCPNVAVSKAVAKSHAPEIAENYYSFI